MEKELVEHENWRWERISGGWERISEVRQNYIIIKSRD